MRSSRISAVAALCVLLAFANIMPTAASQQNMVTIPAGTNVMVRVLDTIDSSKAQQGTRFTAVLETNLAVNGPPLCRQATLSMAASAWQNRPDAPPAPPICNLS